MTLEKDEITNGGNIFKYRTTGEEYLFPFW